MRFTISLFTAPTLDVWQLRLHSLALSSHQRRALRLYTDIVRWVNLAPLCGTPLSHITSIIDDSSTDKGTHADIVRWVNLAPLCGTPLSRTASIIDDSSTKIREHYHYHASYWFLEEWTPDEHTRVLCKAAEYNTHPRKCIEMVFPASNAVYVA